VSEVPARERCRSVTPPTAPASSACSSRPNEARRAEGLPDHPEGDTLYQPTNVAPIGFEPNGNETGPGSDVTGAPAAGGRGDPAPPSKTTRVTKD
jgi:hypothetical protein